MRHLFMLLTLLALTSCDEEIGGRSGEGENCTKTADCEDGFVCLDFVCKDPDPPPLQLCTPGLSQPCMCEDGYTMSWQTCCPDGRSYTVCVCDNDHPDVVLPNPVVGWTDPTTGLTWETEASFFVMSWKDAMEHCYTLAGIWRLPTIGELRSLIRDCPDTQTGSDSCEVEEGGCLSANCDDYDLCAGCPYAGGPADGCYLPPDMSCGSFWSSTVVEGGQGHAWAVDFRYASVNGIYNDLTRALCVR